MRTSGFTLIEVLVTLTLIGLIAGLGTMTLRPLRTASLSSERDLIVSLLSRARSRAMANDSDVPHGFCIDSDRYEVVRRDGVVEEQGNVARHIQISGIPACDAPITFSQYSGTTTPARFTLTGGDASITIDVNEVGAILY
jgi:prepilin-type N-terminal cleavage/methylation domain-containing protein